MEVQQAAATSEPNPPVNAPGQEGESGKPAPLSELIPEDKPLATDEDVREVMKHYWTIHTGEDPDDSNMMLMNDASDINYVEQREIFSKLPNLYGKTVLELGAGIGRFTAYLAKKCAHVTAVDFMQASIDKNQRLNEKLGNTSFICADVCKLEFESDKQFDVVFSNWLMMYLTDEEVKILAHNMVKWCKPGGIIFFRESCAGGPSGDKKRAFNPTKYRQADQYTTLYQSLGLEKKLARQVECYIDLKAKTNQYVWCFQKPVPKKHYVSVCEQTLGIQYK